MSLAINTNLIILRLLILIDQSQQTVYTHKLAMELLRAVGIKLAEWVSLEGIHDEAIDESNGIITLARTSECPITIVRGTEKAQLAEVVDNEPADNCTHSNGWRLNLLKNDCIEKYIIENFRKKDSHKWIAGSGNIYIEREHHWEVQYKEACDRSTASDSNYFKGSLNEITNISFISQTELCKRNGGSCISDSRPKNWCYFRDGLCEVKEGLKYNIKCCVPKNRDSCAQKGGNCIFDHSCDPLNSLAIPNSCPNLPANVICCKIINISQKETSYLQPAIEFPIKFGSILIIICLSILFIIRKIRLCSKNISKKGYVVCSSTFLTDLTDCQLNKLNQVDIEILNDHKVKRGNEGDVFIGILKPKNEKVAIKICRNGNYQLEDLENEIRLLAMCSHPNIIIFRGYYCAQIGTQMNVPHIVTEFMGGGTLEEMCLLNEEPIPVRKLLNILEQVAQGMAYLAKLNLVHRDLSPQNCMLDSSGQMVKIIDFGLCHYIDEYRNDKCRVFQSRYTAMECLDSSNKFSEKTDIWSFGVLAWRLSTNKIPYSWLQKMDAEALRIELQRFLAAGNRLNCIGPKDRRQLCSPEIYNSLIAPCWHSNAQIRPNFMQMIETIKQISCDIDCQQWNI